MKIKFKLILTILQLTRNRQKNKIFKKIIIKIMKMIQ